MKKTLHASFSILILVNVVCGAKLGSRVDAFVKEFGEYEEIVEREKETQYVWNSDGYEVVLNVGHDLTKVSIQFLDSRYENAKSIEWLTTTAKEFLPPERFKSLNWQDLSNYERFVLHDQNKDTTIYYEWHADTKKSQYMIYVRNLTKGK